MSKEQRLTPRDIRQTLYSRLPDMKLPENFVIRDGFLCKGNTPVTLVTSGIIEAAAQGFLHVGEAEDYETE
ncbi:MAG: hypothetical protein ACOYVD_09370 [Bacillota bacterium]